MAVSEKKAQRRINGRMDGSTNKGDYQGHDS